MKLFMTENAYIRANMDLEDWAVLRIAVSPAFGFVEVQVLCFILSIRW